MGTEATPRLHAETGILCVPKCLFLSLNQFLSLNWKKKKATYFLRNCKATHKPSTYQKFLNKLMIHLFLKYVCIWCLISRNFSFWNRNQKVIPVIAKSDGKLWAVSTECKTCWCHSSQLQYLQNTVSSKRSRTVSWKNIQKLLHAFGVA